MGNGGRLQSGFRSRKAGVTASLQAHRDNRLWSWSPGMQGAGSDRTRLRAQGPLGNILPTNPDPPSPISPQKLSQQVFRDSFRFPLVLLTSPEGPVRGLPGPQVSPGVHPPVLGSSSLWSREEPG